MKEGTVPVPPLRPCASYYLFGVYRGGGSHSGGGETPVSVPPGSERFL